MTVQSSIIEELIALVPDPALAEKIRARYYEDLRAQTSFVQNRVGHLELDLRSMLQESLGATNTMIADVLTAVHASDSRQEAAAAELRAEFQSGFLEVGEGMSGLRADVDDLHVRDARQYDETRARQDHADSEIERLSARTDTAHDRIAALEVETQHLASLLAARPSPAKAQATYDGVQRILVHLGLTLDESEV